ncbi:hypothetical protein GOEFS_019_00110 [Gordonia effusa NBRC 100432]|uniref:DUF4190 domain-containing protein n=1 Tax=Gordonia effusa NBRC 100432 TaxID=1077974 RepID=H0QW97_9ACTN|nr:DUF4190 domain-containing protein [Gordonia effusa]GAB17098.1 hypothetical protein GOEFS_019_00110 [Gordonia effusa NBRC 100432]
MTGPDMSKPGPSAEPGAYDQTQLRDISKMDLNKQPPSDDFAPTPTPTSDSAPIPDYQQPSTPYIAPGADSQPSYPGYPPQSYPSQPAYPAYPQPAYPQPGYPVQQPYGVQYPGYGYAPRSTNGKAVASMILSLLGIFATCGVLGIPGVILGHIAKKEIDESNGTQDGAGMALAGIIMGWISVVFIAAFVIFILIGIIASSSA